MLQSASTKGSKTGAKILVKLCCYFCLVGFLMGCSAGSTAGRETISNESPTSNGAGKPVTAVASPEQSQPLPAESLPKRTELSIPGSLQNEPTLTIEPETQPLIDVPSATQAQQNNETEASKNSPSESTPPAGEPLAALFPTADIQILQPGAGSQVISPFGASVVLKGPVAAPYRVELLGRDGANSTNERLLYRQVWAAPPGSDKPETTPSDLFFHISIDFGIKGIRDNLPTEEARLVVTRLDAYDRIQAVNSVDLILQGADELGDRLRQDRLSTPSEGDENAESIPPSGGASYFLEPDVYIEIHIQQPTPGAVVNGGELLVSGLKRTLKNEGTEIPDQLFVELVAEDGRVVGQRVIAVVPTSDGDHGQFSAGQFSAGQFSATIPYRVTESTPVRLIIFEDGSPFSTYAHLSSLEIILEP